MRGHVPALYRVYVESEVIMEIQLLDMKTGDGMFRLAVELAYRAEGAAGEDDASEGHLYGAA